MTTPRRLAMTTEEREIRAARKLPGISTWPRSLEGYIEVKALRGTRSPIRSTNYNDFLPKGKRPGRWTPKMLHPIRCERGWHVSLQPSAWAAVAGSDGRFFVCETRGERDAGRYDKGWHSDNMSGDCKSAYSQIRLVVELTGTQVTLVEKINLAIRNQRWLEVQRRGAKALAKAG